jgi:hypothetical protein
VSGPTNLKLKSVYIHSQLNKSNLSCNYSIFIYLKLPIVIRVDVFIIHMRQKFSAGSKCECMCHGKAGITEYCGYCSSSHRRMNTSPRPRR